MLKKVLCACTCIILAVAIIAGCVYFRKPGPRQTLSQWNQDGVIKELISYVEDVTDKNSPNFIPQDDRIVVFDLDGTLIGEQFPIYFEWIMYAKRVLEDPDYEATQTMKDVAFKILEAGISKEIPEEMELVETFLFDAAFNGMPVDTYKEYVQNFINQEADSFDGLCYKDAYFRPMQQVLQYLEDNDFTLYICSGSDRDADRVIASGFYNFKNYHVIGSDSYYWSENRPEIDTYRVFEKDSYYWSVQHVDINSYLSNQLKGDEKLTRTNIPVIKNVKSAKPVQIYQEIGQKPVLAFGNSTGDLSMFTYTTTGNKYKTAAFCVVPDDDVREYAFPKKVEKLTALCNENGWHAVSMKNDFLTIYGDGVTKNPGKLTYTEKLMDMYQEAKKAA